MRPGWAARSCIRAVERYRRRGAARGSGCRFDPSCSTYALEAFRTRRLLVGIWMVAWRILRCNPLVRLGTRDPVARRRLRPRPNAFATSSTVAALVGMFVIGLTAFALAQGVNGGCTATVNGRDPATMTRADPLVVSEGEVVRVDGVVPASAQAMPEDQVQSTTVITVSGIEGVFGVSSESHPGQGYAWGGQVSVDDYLKWGVGLYKVEGEATGTPGWTCAGTGYVKLDGNPLSKPIGQGAAGLTIVGGLGVVASTFSKRRPDDMMTAAPTAQDIKEDFGRDVDGVLGLPPAPQPSIWEWDPKGNALVEFGCLFFLLGPLGIDRLIGAAVVAARPSLGRVWVHGHPAWGAVSGLFLGVGLAVLGQQYALWPLTVVTAIAFPVYAGALGGVRGWLGRPYKAEFRSRHDST